MSDTLPDFRDFDPTFGHWLAGFIDGEGSFAITMMSRSQGFRVAFKLTLRDDDKAILEEIQERTGLGDLIPVLAHGNSKPQVTWQVQRKLECLALVNLLDRFSLRAKKAKDYTLWRRAVLMWNSSGNDTLMLSQIASDLRLGRAYRD